MPFDSSGTFNRVRSWDADAAANILIRSDFHDNHDNDIAAGLSGVITKDGRTQPTANIPFNQKKIINLGEPTSPSDAATKNYVDSAKTFSTGMSITGANAPNGMLTFSSTTGITGLSWANADMSWVGKVAEAGKWQQRIALNSKGDASGTDVLSIDKAGNINCAGFLTNNLSNDGTNWRVNTLGTGTSLKMINGVFTLSSNDTVTTADNSATTLVDFFTVGQASVTLASQASHAMLNLQKMNGTGAFVCRVGGFVGTKQRWGMDLGDATAETATDYVGSNFMVYAWNNAGTAAKSMMNINRSTNLVQFWGDVFTTTGNYSSNSTQACLAAQSGNVILRPYGEANATNQMYVSTDGYAHFNTHIIIDTNTTNGIWMGMGFRGRNGSSGGFFGNFHNFFYQSGYIYGLVDVTNVGAIQMVCDYRTKRNETPLPSMWDKVKSLEPIAYQYKASPYIIDDKDDDEERWGFVAHDLQAKLTRHAASFDKDVPNALQSPNLMVVVTALTKALQEAQARIEALEAKLP